MPSEERVDCRAPGGPLSDPGAASRAGAALRHRLASLLRSIGLPYPRDLEVLLRSAGRVWHVPVFTYHSIGEPAGGADDADYYVTPAAFREQMACLAAHGYQTIFAGELVEAVASRSRLPARTAVLTFDDGFASAREHAWPALAEHGHKASVFLISDRTRRGEPGYLAREDIRSLADTGLVEFGSHTRTHRRLSTLSRAERASEIEESKRAIEDMTGRNCATFCYPYGDLDDRALSGVRDAGYLGAFGNQHGVLHACRTLFCLARIPARTEPVERFATKLHGWRARRGAADVAR